MFHSMDEGKMRTLHNWPNRQAILQALFGCKHISSHACLSRFLAGTLLFLLGPVFISELRVPTHTLLRLRCLHQSTCLLQTWHRFMITCNPHTQICSSKKNLMCARTGESTTYNAPVPPKRVRQSRHRSRHASTSSPAATHKVKAANEAMPQLIIPNVM